MFLRIIFSFFFDLCALASLRVIIRFLLLHSLRETIRDWPVRAAHPTKTLLSFVIKQISSFAVSKGVCHTPRQIRSELRALCIAIAANLRAGRATTGGCPYKSNSFLRPLRSLRLMIRIRTSSLILISPQRRRRFNIQLELAPALLDRHAIIAPRRVERDVTRAHVSQHFFRRAF